MRKDFVNEVARTQKVKRADLIEKDLILHQIIFDLSKNKFCHDNFLFKGGTCLAKCYLDYFRFSEDIDFTWKDQSVFEGKSQKEVRRYLSQVISRIGEIFEEIAKEHELDFRCLKNDRNYVELTGGDKTCTFKVWYQSEVLGRKSFLKVQMNFMEKICYPFKGAELKSLIAENPEELILLYPEYEVYTKKIAFDVYDCHEILGEKIRAILTRQGTKARDYLDVYLIEKQFGIQLDDIFACVLEKTQFTLNLYERYRQNLEEKKQTLLSTPFNWGEEKGLLLKEIDEKDFYKFTESLRAFLKKVMDSLSGAERQKS
ncbi:MAG: nucleotidyl transferase AbiEii/AbiGii toxin family protein [Candidatus Bathyarchaeia archaeon]|jgi:predicted nucleotidyltransferase component of viral defense system